MTLAGADFCGWGAKQGSRVRSWKNRYFVLRGRELAYYAGAARDGRGVDEKGRVTVAGVEYAPELRNGLLVRGAKRNQVLRMTTTDAAQSRALFRAIKQALGESQASFRVSAPERLALGDLGSIQSQSHSRSSSRSWSSSQLQYGARAVGDLPKEKERASAVTGHAEEPSSSRRGRQRCEGWLDKRGGRSGAWKPRYFVLEDGLLEYRKRPDGDVCAENLVVDVAYGGEGPSAWLEVSFASDSDDDPHSLCVRAASPDDTRRWMRALCDLVGKPEPPTEPPTEPPQRSSSSVASTVSASSASPPDGQDAALASPRAPLWSSGVQSATAKSATARTREQAHPYDAVDRASVQLEASPASQASPAARQQYPSDGDSPASEAGVIYRGWLLKKGQHFKTWKRRYFVLTRSTLVYYRSSNVKGAVLGSGVVFDVAVGKERPFSLDVRFRNGRQLHIVSPSQEVFSMWHRALRVASELTESFLHSRGGSAGAALGPVADEFDHDVEDADDAGDAEAEFTEGDVEEYQSQLGTGARLWAAAMKGEPETERRYSWSSLVDGEEPDPAVEPDAAKRAPSADATGSSASTADPAPESAPPGCRGWLMVEEDKLQSLRRRYCTLFGSTLSCYKSETSPLLRSLVVVAVADWESVPFALRVSGLDGAELVVAAQSNQEYQRWWRALYASALDQSERKAEEHKSDLRRAHGGGAHGASSTGDARASTSTCSGWLEKEGRRFKTWKRRYFEVRHGALIYYSDVDGAVLGHGAVAHASVDAYKYHTLNIELAHGRTMRVTAADERDMRRWLDALNKTRAESSAAASLPNVSDGRVLAVRDEGVTEASAPAATGKRLNSSDYLANDSITDESYRRILPFEDNLSLLGTVNEAGRFFKGELVFGERAATAVGSLALEAEDARNDGDGSGADTMDTANGVEYYRALVEEEALAKERRLAADEARATGTPTVHSCVGGCCIVM